MESAARLSSPIHSHENHRLAFRLPTIKDTESALFACVGTFFGQICTTAEPIRSASRDALSAQKFSNWGRISVREEVFELNNREQKKKKNILLRGIYDAFNSASIVVAFSLLQKPNRTTQLMCSKDIRNI